MFRDTPRLGTGDSKLSETRFARTSGETFRVRISPVHLKVSDVSQGVSFVDLKVLGSVLGIS